jgi:hypothetical protein
VPRVSVAERADEAAPNTPFARAKLPSSGAVEWLAEIVPIYTM